ncbi:hypothetical protein ABZ446_36155 [Streptomyces sp. NPDC005813]
MAVVTMFPCGVVQDIGSSDQVDYGAIGSGNFAYRAKNTPPD